MTDHLQKSFESFKAAIYPGPEVPGAAQLATVKDSFFAGAAGALAIILKGAEEQPDTPEGDAAAQNVITDLYAEIQTWGQAVADDLKEGA